MSPFSRESERLWMWWLCALLAAAAASSGQECSGANIEKAAGHESEDALIYGLTQDCQLFFARPGQLQGLSQLKVDASNSYCYPNLVQMHVWSHETLLLLIKQAGNRICTLRIHIPPVEILFGPTVFSYSVLSSLPYAVCSHSADHAVRLDPDLSFMDPAFSDVIYFADPSSHGAEWMVRQFLLDSHGHLKLTHEMPHFPHPAQSGAYEGASEYVMQVDAQRDKLYRAARFADRLVTDCAFDALFKPDQLESSFRQLPHHRRGTWLNSLSADGKLLVYSETLRAGTSPSTRLWAMNTSSSNSTAHCLAHTPFSFDVGVIRIRTLRSVKDNPMPNFDGRRREMSTKSPNWRSNRLKDLHEKGVTTPATTMLNGMDVNEVERVTIKHESTTPVATTTKTTTRVLINRVPIIHKSTPLHDNEVTTMSYEMSTESYYYEEEEEEGMDIQEHPLEKALEPTVNFPQLEPTKVLPKSSTEKEKGSSEEYYNDEDEKESKDVARPVEQAPERSNAIPTLLTANETLDGAAGNATSAAVAASLIFSCVVVLM